MADFSGTRLTAGEFRELCRAEFSFLLSDFHFAEEPAPNGNGEPLDRISFLGPAVRVIAEGRCYGSALCVKLERLAGGSCHLVDLVPHDTEGAEPLLNLGDQDALIRHAASMMRQHAFHALSGQESAFQDAAERRLEREANSPQAPNRNQDA